MLLKLPAEIIERYGAVIRALDWTNWETASLADLFPDGDFTDADVLERVASGAGVVIRPRGIGAASRLRTFAQTLPSVSRPTPEEIEAVLKRRNPETSD